ncbi:MAG: YciI family protein [Myxococcota bacterium]
MSKRTFLCLQRSQSDEVCEPPPPSQMEEMYKAFNAWKDKYADNLVDLGGRLKSGGKVITTNGASDGPFVEAKEVIGGYMILQADDIDEAAAVARGVLSPSSSIEVREIHKP